MFLFQKRDSARRKTIERLYGTIVAQARTPVFYEALGVPDTVEGRFDLLVLHMHLVNEQLTAEGEAGIALGQELLDHFFEDMDGSLREIGIGDLSVPKKMRTLAEAYLGRSAAYGAAVAANDVPALSKALARNVFGADDHASGAALASYTIEAARVLREQTPENLLAGRVTFPEPVKGAVHAG
jgi:cytochrome b pre-mRNA-processing protein 3